MTNDNPDISKWNISSTDTTEMERPLHKEVRSQLLWTEEVFGSLGKEEWTSQVGENTPKIRHIIYLVLCCILYRLALQTHTHFLFTLYFHMYSVFVRSNITKI